MQNGRAAKNQPTADCTDDADGIEVGCNDKMMGRQNDLMGWDAELFGGDA
jgi:hypothetical protein